MQELGVTECYLMQLCVSGVFVDGAAWGRVYEWTTVNYVD
jgi:hypothetical protein